MKLILTFFIASIVLVAGKGAWKDGKEYRYRLQMYIKSNNEAIIARARLTISPQSDDLLNGRITNAVYGTTDDPFSGENSDLSKLKSEYNEWPLEKQFKINLENGVIRSVSVDPTMTSDQVNQLKRIVTQFQVDPNPSHLTETEGMNVVYNVREPTVDGECETTYDISPFFDVQSHPEWAQLASLKDKLVRIEKTKNMSNCEEDSDRKEEKELNLEESNLTTVRTTIIISGSPSDYTILSSNSSNTENDFSVYIVVKLESVDDTQTEQENFVVENLTSKVRDKDLPQYSVVQSSAGKCPVLTSAEERWSGCWTRFPSDHTICKSEFSPEWEPVQRGSCNLGFRKDVKCRKSYPRCVSTVCYSAYKPFHELCTDNYKSGDYPLTCGGFDDCSPGFYAARCCPM